MRYVNLSTVLMYRLVSKNVMKRFPDYESLVNAKLMLPKEVERLRNADKKIQSESTWTPLLWATKLITRGEKHKCFLKYHNFILFFSARKEEKIKLEAPVYNNLITSFEKFESSNRMILSYCWMNFPLAYTQLATFTVCMYFGISLFGETLL